MVRGRHPVLSPVQLPKWLPFELLVLMVGRYEEILRDQVIKMMAPAVVPPAGNDSDIQSNPGFTDGSDETISSMSNSWPSFKFSQAANDPATKGW
jgi:hypothetical protein